MKVEQLRKCVGCIAIILLFVFYKPDPASSFDVSGGLKIYNTIKDAKSIDREVKARRRTAQKNYEAAEALSTLLKSKANLKREAAIKTFYRDKGITPRMYMDRLEKAHRFDHQAAKDKKELKFRQELMPSVTYEFIKQGRREARKASKRRIEFIVAKIVGRTSRAKEVAGNIKKTFNTMDEALQVAEGGVSAIKNLPKRLIQKIAEKSNKTRTKIVKPFVRVLENKEAAKRKLMGKIERASQKAQGKIAEGSQKAQTRILESAKRIYEKKEREKQKLEQRITDGSKRAQEKITGRSAAILGGKLGLYTLEAHFARKDLSKKKEKLDSLGVRSKKIDSLVKGTDKGLKKFVEVGATGLYEVYKTGTEAKQTVEEIEKGAKRALNRGSDKVDERLVRGAATAVYVLQDAEYRGKGTVRELKKMGEGALSRADKQTNDLAGNLGGETFGRALEGVSEVEKGLQDMVGKAEKPISKITDPILKDIKAMRKGNKEFRDDILAALNNRERSTYREKNMAEIVAKLNKNPDFQKAREMLALARLGKRDPDVVRKEQELLKMSRRQKDLEDWKKWEATKELLAAAEASKKKKQLEEASKKKQQLETDETGESTGENPLYDPNFKNRQELEAKKRAKREYELKTRILSDSINLSSKGRFTLKGTEKKREETHEKVIKSGTEPPQCTSSAQCVELKKESGWTCDPKTKKCIPPTEKKPKTECNNAKCEEVHGKGWKCNKDGKCVGPEDKKEKIAKKTKCVDAECKKKGRGWKCNKDGKCVGPKDKKEKKPEKPKTKKPKTKKKPKVECEPSKCCPEKPVACMGNCWKKGTDCCGNAGICPPGQYCCGKNDCCYKGEICCKDGGCCPKGTTCCGVGKCCPK